MALIKKYTFDVEPVPKARPRFTRKGFTYTPARTKKAETEIKRLIGRDYSIIDFPIGVAIELLIERPASVKRVYPSVRPDADNMGKLVLDALNGLVYKDDAQICDLIIKKRYSDKNQIIVEIHTLEDS